MASVMVAMVLVSAASAVPEVKDRPRRSTVLPLPRDGNIAVQEELDAARRAGTLAAYDLFLARHPGHKLARTARRERAVLARRAR
jgi:hypothetical protein